MKKSPLKMKVDERKSDLIKRLFVATGDQDYVTARWAYSHCMFHIFYWCSAQAIEKYGKAILLYQDISIANYGHDIIRIYDTLKHSDQKGTIPEIIELPESEAMGRPSWHKKHMSLFVDYINEYGSPKNRYGHVGTFINGPALQTLDILCKSLRDMIKIKNNFETEFFTCDKDTRADVSDVEWALDIELLLERLYIGSYNVGDSDELRQVFANMNFPFFGDEAIIDGTFGGQYVIGPTLENHLVRLRILDETPENQETIDQLRNWVEQKLKLSPQEKRELGLEVK